MLVVPIDCILILSTYHIFEDPFNLIPAACLINKNLNSSSTIVTQRRSALVGDVCSSDFAIYANQCIPKLCDIHTLTNPLTTHSKQFRRWVGAPRRSTRSSVQDRAMESAIRLAQAHWKACFCVVLRQARAGCGEAGTPVEGTCRRGSQVRSE